MPTPMPDSQPTARVIIELSPNGSIRMESYRNGQRQQLTLTRGQEWWEILDELSMQKKQAVAQLERKAEQEAKQSRLRHNKVWIDTATKFGTGFAVAKIKGDVPVGFGKYLLPEEKPSTKPAKKPSATVDELISLL